MNNANISHLNRAIAGGAEDGTFALPKGSSGKVKMAPKIRKPSSDDEVCLYSFHSSFAVSHPLERS